MSRSPDHLVRLIALGIAGVLEQSPCLTWEDILSIHRNVGFSTFLGSGKTYSDGGHELVEVAVTTLSEVRLREAWQLALKMCSWDVQSEVEGDE